MWPRSPHPGSFRPASSQLPGQVDLSAPSKHPLPRLETGVAKNASLGPGKQTLHFPCLCIQDTRPRPQAVRWAPQAALGLGGGLSVCLPSGGLPCLPGTDTHSHSCRSLTRVGVSNRGGGSCMWGYAPRIQVLCPGFPSLGLLSLPCLWSSWGCVCVYMRTYAIAWSNDNNPDSQHLRGTHSCFQHSGCTNAQVV